MLIDAKKVDQYTVQIFFITLQCLVIFELKNINFAIIKTFSFLNDTVVDKLLISEKICSNKKNYKHCIGYLGDYKI